MTNNKKADPSAIFSDSIALFTRSATKAFNDLQIQVRAEVARVEADVQVAQNERDQALNQLQESKKELQRHKEEILKSKAALKESELTVQHHIENYALLQRETTQWKDQAKNWQEHFLRVEQERCSLSSRMDELVTERLIISPLARNPSKHIPSSHSNISQPPTYHSTAPPSASNDAASESPIVRSNPRTTGSRATKHKAKVPSQSELPPYTETVSTPHKVQTSTSGSAPRPRTNRKQTTASSSRAKQAVSATDVPKDSQEPKQIFIRRVHAVVEVKQEEDSDQDISSVEGPLVTPRRSRNGRRVRRIVEDDDYVPENVSPEIGSGDFEEDDELMIGAGDDLSFDVGSSAPGQATRTTVSKKRKLSTAMNSKPKARRKT